MRFLLSVVMAAIAIFPALATPASMLEVERYNGEKTGKYIVMLKDGSTKSSILKSMRTTASHEWDIINGFAGDFSAAELDALRANSNVESISEDGYATASRQVTQHDAPWGLARLSVSQKLSSQDPSRLNFDYTYDTAAGKGVDVYVIDTGINTRHNQFGGRARWGKTFGPYPDDDDNGHGTHCAGSVGSIQFGVAKMANIIAVKVLGANGKGSWSDVISGMDWVRQQAAASRRPSIASMSLSGDAQIAVDSAVKSLTDAGVHVIVAAGNDNIDAASHSPARVPSAITVGASNITDARAWFSNYGAVVDIFAPGEDIISTWVGNDTATKSISGTSMATPHVAGLVAYLISVHGDTTPAGMSARVKALAERGQISNLPSGTVNLLAHNSGFCLFGICI